MRRYQKWLSVGLLALTPQLALANDYASPDAPAAAAKPNPNDELANRVHKRLEKADHKGCSIDIEVRGGVVVLSGSVSNPEQRAGLEKATKSVSGVSRVLNRLEVAGKEPSNSVQQAVASAPRGANRARDVRQVNADRFPGDGIAPPEYPATAQPALEPQRMAFSGQPPQVLAPVPQGPIPQAAPQGLPPQGAVQQMPPNYCPPGAMMGGAPPYGAGGMGGMSGMGGPMGGPGQVAASQYPYSGPFYPYPQIPRGWRKTVLEWDDGYWHLNPRSRTDNWWWYMNPKNW